MIPVHILTGFLGSGKTTLLRQLLNHPEMGRTAVIVNEFGEIGIDHDLLATSDENVVQLTNGCLCCRIRSDLVCTLDDLAVRHGTDPAGKFERVIIETSGLADPVPIVNALMTDDQVRAHYRLAETVATVDGVLGMASLERFAETARQVAVADCIVVTKVDRADAHPEQVEGVLRRIRPEARVLRSRPGRLQPSDLFGTYAPENSREAVPPWLPTRSGRASFVAPAHSSGMASVFVVRHAHLHAATLPLFLSAMAENFGQDLVRLKGIVGIVERPECPAVIHGVQHLYEGPQWLADWPSSDRSTRFVCIGRHLNAEWIRMLLQLLDEEVANEAASRRTGETGSHQ